jgi:ribosomal protein S18 acetylase RimI-like enzyme
MQRLSRDRQRDAAATLALAFQHDPLLAIIQPDAARRQATGRWFMGSAVGYGLTHGEVWGNDDTSAVAVWFPPGKTSLSIVGMLRAGLIRLPLKVGVRHSVRVLSAISATEPFHKQVEGPHWYLLALGTRPERQGQGLGSALVAIGTDQADQARIPVYLETATDADIAFYTKRGFEVIGQTQVQGYTLSGMVRPPQ